ncbi:MAG TPA: type II secretion system F family protein [Candidatus Paceibacterota bacterium]
MKFRYIASEPSGKVVEGNIEATGPADVLEWMASQGLRPVSIKAIGGVEIKGIKGVFSQDINIADKVFLTKYLALMLRVGTDLFRAIDILISDFDKPAVKALLIEIKDSLAKGKPMYTTFTKYPKHFSSVFVNMIKAGEASGNLDSIFEDLSKSLEKEQALRSKLRAAFTYPIILVSLSFMILFLLASFALPRISEVFTSGGLEPPLFSKIVFAIGNFLGDNFLLISIVLVGGVFGLWFFLKKSFIGQRVAGRILNKAPIINQVLYRISIQRFASTFASLLRSGMPIIEALETTADAVGSAELKSSLLRISREGIAKGLTIGESFQRETFFPRTVVNLIAISEKAGHMEQILETLSDFYESEIDASVKTMLSVLEPALLLVIGLIVGTIALSIIIPVYQLVGQI